MQKTVIRDYFHIFFSCSIFFTSIYIVCLSNMHFFGSHVPFFALLVYFINSIHRGMLLYYHTACHCDISDTLNNFEIFCPEQNRERMAFCCSPFSCLARKASLSYVLFMFAKPKACALEKL